MWGIPSEGCSGLISRPDVMHLAGEGGPVALEHLRQVLLGYGLTGHTSNQVRVPACAANCILFHAPIIRARA
jgi:hypothetical protein